MARRNIFPIFLPQSGCRHRCVYCDQRQISGYRRRPTIAELGSMLPEHLPADTELAFYGGTFTALDDDVRRACLAFAKEARAAGKIAATRVSTHPLYISEAIVAELQDAGVTLVELGIQCMDDAVLAASGRGHAVDDVLRAIDVLRRAGMAWGAQLMVGLPGATAATDVASAAMVATCGPAQARIYPTLVLAGTDLEAMTAARRYAPLSLDAAVATTARMAALFENDAIPVIRMGLPPLAGGVVAGPEHPAFGHLVRCHLKKEQLKMVLSRWHGGDVRIVAPRSDLPLVFGHDGSTVASVAQGHRLRVSGGDLPRGDLALTAYDGGDIAVYLAQADFLKNYTEKDRIDHCI